MTENVKARLRAELREAEMRIYRKGEKNAENCGFSESTRL